MIRITLLQLIKHQTEFNLVPNYLEEHNFNPNLVQFKIIQKLFFLITLPLGQYEDLVHHPKRSFSFNKGLLYESNCNEIQWYKN